MFLTAVIFIIYFSLSDLAKWMSQNGATDKEKFFVVGGIFLLILVIMQILLERYAYSEIVGTFILI